MNKEAKFKVNDRIRYYGTVYRIDGIEDGEYYVFPVDGTEYEDAVTGISFNAHDKMELVPYSASELEPFQKILIRDSNDEYWIPSFFGFINHDHPKYYVCVNGWRHSQCVPYNSETAHLLGTDTEYNGYYKTW
jgi:hypothetical protein